MTEWKIIIDGGQESYCPYLVDGDPTCIYPDIDHDCDETVECPLRVKENPLNEKEKKMIIRAIIYYIDQGMSCISEFEFKQLVKKLEAGGE